MLTELQQEHILKASQYAQQRFIGFESGHDWWHTWRVWQLANHIAGMEGADSYICSMSALLHDIQDHKFYSPVCLAGQFETRDFLESLELDINLITTILFITENLSYSSEIDKDFHKSIEFKVVQDADRLDAMGAIGIARAFNYGGYKQRPIYHPGSLPKNYTSTSEYRAGESSSIMHFYEKLLKLKEGLNTSTACRIAEERHNYMEEYLKQFFKEWSEFAKLI